MITIDDEEPRTDNADAVFRGLARAMSVSCNAITSYARAKSPSSIIHAPVSSIGLLMALISWCLDPVFKVLGCHIRCYMGVRILIKK